MQTFSTDELMRMQQKAHKPKPGAPERAFATSIANELRRLQMLPQNRNRLLFNHMPNIQHVAAKRQSWSKQQGYQTGWPDLVVIADGEHSYWELKSKTGTLSQEQRWHRDAMRKMGLTWELLRAPSFLPLIQWLKGRGIAV